MLRLPQFEKESVAEGWAYIFYIAFLDVINFYFTASDKVSFGHEE
jgi:hypothetical protein